MDDDIDPKPKLEQECHPSCERSWTEYEECAKRVEGTEGECSGQYFDYIECIDKCVAPKLWHALK